MRAIHPLRSPRRSIPCDVSILGAVLQILRPRRLSAAVCDSDVSRANEAPSYPVLEDCLFCFCRALHGRAGVGAPIIRSSGESATRTQVSLVLIDCHALSRDPLMETTAMLGALEHGCMIWLCSLLHSRVGGRAPLRVASSNQPRCSLHSSRRNGKARLKREHSHSRTRGSGSHLVCTRETC